MRLPGSQSGLFCSNEVDYTRNAGLVQEDQVRVGSR
jgi:hypothetical protein